MKKFLLLYGLFCLTAVTSYAQRNTSFFQLGIKAGTNLSQLKTGNFIAGGQYQGQTLRTNLEDSWGTRSGFLGGVYMRFGRTFFIQPEVMYSGRAASYDVQVIDSEGKPVGSTQQVKIKSENIDVPLLVGLKLGPLRVNTGPVASFVIGSNESLRDAITKYTNSNVNDVFNQAIWGYQLGGGLDLGNISLDVRYEDSLKSLGFNSGMGSNDPFRQKTKNWQVTLGFRII